MRKLLIALSVAYALATPSTAQDCNTYLFMTDNAQIQMTVYDKKGDESGIQTWKVTDVKKDGDGYTSTISSSFKDAKGKEIVQGSGSFKCTNGMLQADVKMLMPQEQMQMFKSTDAKLTSMYLEYPHNMSVGQSLKDVDFEMDMEMSNGMKANMNFKQTNRKVNSKEKVTSPAGTWDAFVISYDGYMKMKMGIGIPVSFQGKEWFVPGMGVVKTESYAKNGKLNGSTLITAINK